MPELPEVETVCRTLAHELAGRSIVAVQSIGWPRTIAAPTPEQLCAALCNRAVLGVQRRAKYILIHLDHAQTLVIHLRMTGQVLIVEATTPGDKHTHVVLQLDDQRELRFHDTRKFGRWWLLDQPELAALEASLGSEPLEQAFTPAVLKQRLAGRKTQLKPLLLDQKIVAGLGNIYVDEALWRASLHPLRSANSLSDAELSALHAGIVAALTEGVERRGTTLSNYRDARGAEGENQHHLRAYGRTGQPCPRCGSPIERSIVGQRSTHLCPFCQQR